MKHQRFTSVVLSVILAMAVLPSFAQEASLGGGNPRGVEIVKADSNTVPQELMEKAARYYANERWPGSRLISSTPYYAFDGSINAWAVQFAKKGSAIGSEKDVASRILQQEERLARVQAERPVSLNAGKDATAESVETALSAIEPEVTVTPFASASGQGGVRVTLPPGLVAEAARARQEAEAQQEAEKQYKRTLREARNAAVLADEVGTVIIAGRFDLYPLLERFDGAAWHQKDAAKVRMRAKVAAGERAVARTFYVGPMAIFHEPGGQKVSPTGRAKGVVIRSLNAQDFDFSQKPPSADDGRLAPAEKGKNSIEPQEMWRLLDTTGSPLPGGGTGTMATPTVQIQGVPYYHQDDYGAASCGPVASAQALGYWDDNGYGNLVDNGDADTGHEDELIYSLMRAEQYAPTVGTYGDKIKPGIEAVANSNTYGNNLNFLVTDYYKNVSWANHIKAEINARRPFVYFNFSKTKYPNWAHFTTGVGYNETGTKYLYVNYNYPPDTPYELNWDNIASDNQWLYKILPGSGNFDCLWSEDFEGTAFPGWWVGSNGASLGHWGRTSYRAHNQTPNPYPPGADTPYSAWCMRSNIAPPGPYAKNANGWAIFGPFSTYKSSGELAAYIWRNIPGSGGSFVGLMASLDGSNFSGTAYWGDYRSWNRCSLGLASVYSLGNVLNKPNVWVALWFKSDNGATAEGAYVDNLTIKLGPATHFVVTSPAGGESWLRGTAHDISWRSMGNLGVGNVNLRLYKGGLYHSEITASTPNDGIYQWNIPASGSGGSDFKIRVGNPSNAAQFGYSPENFELRQLPSITVTQPNGGEEWQKGRAYNITWASTGYPGANVRIVLLKLNTQVAEIVASTPNDGYYSWLIPNSLADGTDYRVRVTSTSNASYTDTSNAYFTILTPTLQLTYPVGGEIWRRGQSRTIRWTSVGNTGLNVKLDLYLGRTITSITTSTPNDGAFAWTIPAKIAPSERYRVRVASTSVSAYDFSDFVTITTGPLLRMISPNGGEEWPRNVTRKILWQSTEMGLGIFRPAPVKLQLYKSGVLHTTITASTNDTGTYDWLISPSILPDDGYAVRVSPLQERTYDAFSSSTFRIVGPSVRVTSPGRGVIWYPGSGVSIGWESMGFRLTNMQLLLLKGDSVHTTISASAPNTGSFKWTVPSRIKFGSDYRVKIIATADPYIMDVSRYPITIQAKPTISLGSPNGGEIWVHGSGHKLGWNSSGIPETDVRLDLYKGGVFLQTIGTVNIIDDAFPWQVPFSAPPGTDYRVRATSLWNTSYFDESNTNFTIERSNAAEEEQWPLY